MTLIKDGKEDYSRGTCTMGFCNGGERLSSTMNTKKSGYLWPRDIVEAVNGKLPRGNIKAREILATQTQQDSWAGRPV